MFDMALHVRVSGLLEAVAAIEDELSANELELVRHLKEKYADPGPGDETDARVLEVILRNVAIRKGYDIDVKTDPGRVIPVKPRAKGKD
jgi:hypothetical protein